MPSYDDINDVPRDPATGGMLMGAQRAIGLARMHDDETGDLVLEVIVLPNATFFFSPYQNGALIGDHVLTTPQYAQGTVEEMQSECDRITGCGCKAHAGKTMVPCDLSELE